MIKEIIEEIKLHKIAYLIEVIQKKDFDSKVDALNKIQKMKITKNIGLFLIDSSKYDYGINDNNGGISSELISLCFKNYYDEYTYAINKVFDKLSPDAQNRVVFLLSSIDNESALKLYVDLVLKYYKDSDFIPISNLFERPYLYTILFPKLYKALKFKKVKNNVLILLNDYLNAGVVSKVDIKKNSKIISDSILRVFNEALSYNFKNTTEALSNVKYLDLRFFLEISTNIEYYVSTPETKKVLDKLFKKNDNQLNLFILDNYIRKGKNISKLSLEKLAKDDASRYPLFDMLNSYNMNSLMPKKYLNKKLLAKSEFYINFMIYTRYENDIKNYRFVEKIIINNFEYYIFKFKYTYNYKNVSNDFTTNYVMHVSKIDKYNDKKITREFVGISGGYDLNKDSYKLAFNHNRLLFSERKENESIEEVINKIGIDKDFVIEEDEDELDKTDKKKKFRFSYILIGLLFIFICLLIGCVIYAYDPDIIKINKGDGFVSSSLSKTTEFKEISGNDIFNQPESEYFVLFYKKTNNNKNKYYTYVNEYLKNNIKIYYVNMEDEKNKFLYSNNDINFIITNDRLLKVKDKEYEYYVDGKENILNDMKTYINIVEENNKNQNK